MLKNKAITDNSGNVIILVAISFMALMGILGITVDAGRLYVVQSKAQNAADAALLGAVATKDVTNLTTETNRLFNSNYPAGYAGATVGALSVKTLAPGVFSVSTTIKVPMTIMQIFGKTSVNVPITSVVKSGYQLSSPQTLELALVFDNSSTSNTAAMAAAGTAMSNILFNGAATATNMHISVIPFDTTVDVGSNRAGWVQNAYLASYNATVASAGGGKGFVSNRNSDDPPNSYVDVSDVAPTSDATRFRVPPTASSCFGSIAAASNSINCISQVPSQVAVGDTVSTSLGLCSGHHVISIQMFSVTVDGPHSFTDCDPPRTINPMSIFFNNTGASTADKVNINLAKMQFGLDTHAGVQSALDSMTATGGNRRINVGLMWGWFTQSPAWQGLFSPSLPGLPAADNILDSKNLVLVVTGQDNVYTGQNGESNDDTTAASLCAAIQGRGIQVYTVGFGAAGSYNQTLVKGCATGPNYTFTATTQAELTSVFQTIADDIQSSTVRLAQ